VTRTTIHITVSILRRGSLNNHFKITASCRKKQSLVLTRYSSVYLHRMFHNIAAILRGSVSILVTLLSTRMYDGNAPSSKMAIDYNFKWKIEWIGISSNTCHTQEALCSNHGWDTSYPELLFMIFVKLSQQKLWQYLNSGCDHFLPHSFWFTIH
jgi:hypothetical protein